MMRRIRTRYTGSHAGYLWAFAEPLAWIFVIKMAVQHGESRPPLGTSFEVFLGTGIIVARCWRQSVSALVSPLLKPAKQTMPTLHRLDAAYAMWLLEVITGTIVLVIFLTAVNGLGHDAVPGNLLVCILAVLTMAALSLSFGLCFAVVLTLIPALAHFRGVIMLLVFVSSGFALLVDRVGPELRQIIVWNPLLHVIEWFRMGFYTGYVCQSLSLAYPFIFIVVTMLLGLAGERALRRRTRNINMSYDEDA